MKKTTFLVIPLFIALAAFFVYVFVQIKNSGRGALQITATPQSNIYLDGKLLGKTPLCKCDPEDMLVVGEYTVKIEPVEKGYRVFEEKIPIGKSVLTVVDRTFDKGSSSEGSIITLSQLSDNNALELFVISFPDKANVFVDNNPSGSTPLLIKDIKKGDHEVHLVKDGFREKIIRVKGVSGYKLTSTVYLGVLSSGTNGELNPTITPKLSTSPTASPSAKPGKSVVILQTPTGFLRVRKEPSTGAEEIAQVRPGDSFELLDEGSGWFKIKLKDSRTGWVSGQYARKE